MLERGSYIEENETAKRFRKLPKKCYHFKKAKCKICKDTYS